jgi:alkaline phosphatase D
MKSIACGLASALVLASLAGCAGPSEGAPTDARAIDGGPTHAPDVGLERDVGSPDATADTSDPDASTRADAGSDLDPPPPTPPDVVHHLSLAIRTGDATADASDGRFEVCVNATDCFPLDVPDVDDFRSGELDVFHFEGLDLPRADVRRAQLRWLSGSDGWRPVCMEMQLDGEPVYCQGGLDTRLGDGAGEVRAWRDPLGIHEACGTCYPERVTHGPLVGSVGPDEVRILVRTDATRPLSLELVDATGARVDAGPRYPRPGNDFTTVFHVTGLRPRTEYTAHVTIAGTRLGRAAHFRTAPRDGSSGVYRIGFGSCANDNNFPVQPVFDTILARDLEMFLFLGDNHYGDTGFTEAHWFRYRRTMEMPARARFLASTPVIATWDDHDFTGNDSTRFAPGRERALRGFTDYWANPAFGTDTTDGTFFVQHYGDVDFFVLDDRYYRDRPGTDGGSILGDRQADWLEDALRASTATFRVIASGSSFTRAGESWLDYPASRGRLFRFIESERLGGVVLLGGDIHRTQIRWIERPGAYDLPELVSSGMATREEGTCPSHYPVTVGDAREVWCSQEMPTFMVLDFDTTLGDPQLVVRHIDGASGAVRHTLTIHRSDLGFR